MKINIRFIVESLLAFWMWVLIGIGMSISVALVAYTQPVLSWAWAFFVLMGVWLGLLGWALWLLLWSIHK